MRRDPLLALVRLRRLALDTAERDLAGCLNAMSIAELAVIAARSAIDREAAAAAHLEATDAVAFANWLPAGIAATQDAVTQQNVREHQSEHARSHLASERAARQAIADLVERRAEERRMAALRREQAMLDEHGQRRLRRATINPTRSL